MRGCVKNKLSASSRTCADACIAAYNSTMETLAGLADCKDNINVSDAVNFLMHATRQMHIAVSTAKYQRYWKDQCANCTGIAIERIEIAIELLSTSIALKDKDKPSAEIAEKLLANMRDSLVSLRSAKSATK